MKNKTLTLQTIYEGDDEDESVYRFIRTSNDIGIVYLLIYNF